ncbi:hypothetical protein DEA8626_03866 [Defluviimonas aquaemixtae]|uniref:Sulfatase-modifying factor enzyme-like domain-containing protein n=1 Tax=Albidovulum aquaemixtae TaxID=1542388 RepID=A0A2R8BNC9_9RHOB|nr:SUMF1/EgtB/PvdO family nonheme iron enzyme [Defluviimonas aquaemixtae]SPH24833.1 hypothetical protein DEA8626_03866 [Defluviimonas aquaemixtae]
MHGNVLEWVEDCFMPWHHPEKRTGGALRFESREFVVFKGGTALAGPWQARSAMRVGPPPSNDGQGSTFRLVRELDAE